jgi:hypothetical protein
VNIQVELNGDVVSNRSRTRLSLAIVVAALAIAPAVTACSFNPIESAIEEATGGNVDIGGTTSPDDFPAEVPLADGEVVSAFGVGTAPEKAWNVTIKVADASALDAIRSQLEGAGFSSEIDDAAIGGLTGGMYANEKYGVLVVVAEDGNGGWAASYTVTSAAK